MEVIYQREMTYNEEWMVVLTTDHGGEGTSHGDQEDLTQTRQVWALIRLPGVTQQQLTQIKSVDLMPTMLKWLEIIGVPNLDGNPLI
jgi:arylsulfatase A-like enzyme